VDGHHRDPVAVAREFVAGLGLAARDVKESH